MNFHFIIFFCNLLTVGVFGKTTRIVGGIDANIKHFSYSASLKRISDNEHICGGSIISHWHILTTAHCVDQSFITPSNLKIHIGATNISSSSGILLYPELIFVHPVFLTSLNEKSSILGDIAIIKVTRKIEFNEFQKKITLPVVDIHINYIASLSGWGITNYLLGNNSGKLQKTWLKILSNNYCSNLLPSIHYIDQFCAFQRLGVGPCIGDSGSALAYHDTIVGIASIAIPCAMGDPDLFTNVYFHMNFINQILNM